jgi:HAD superfamily hydrolase (TIGR01549 family)
MVKAVIFDFFGVLAQRGSESFRQAYFKNDKEKYTKVKKIQDQHGLGAVGYDEFINKLAQIGGVSRDTVLNYTENYVPNVELLNYIGGRLKPNYKIGIVSNAGTDRVLEILGDDSVKMFDDIVLSYQVGFIKPESEIYMMSAKNLGVPEEECIFTDDILTYCQGAEVVGMSTIWYKDFAQFKTDLEKLLAADPNN